MADNSNNLFAKSLSTGYHRGQPERGAGFRGTATEGNNVNKMQESDVQRKMASEATLRGDINGLEKRVKKIAQDMLNDSKECVILINEAKALNPEKDGGDQNEDGEDKSKGFILHNLLWFVEELKRTYTRQKQVHNYLQQQTTETLPIKYLVFNRVIAALQKRIEDLETQVGKRRTPGLGNSGTNNGTGYGFTDQIYR